MSSLLDDGDECGRRLIRLLSRGHAVTAELQRVADALPNAFQASGEQSKQYVDVLPDFKVFRTAGALEAIAATEEGIRLDEESRELHGLHGRFARRSFRLLSASRKYYLDLCSWLEDLDYGRFATHSVEELLQDPDGQQLLPEAVGMLGALLLLFEERFPGPAREKAMVLIYRLTVGTAEEPEDYQEVCHLFQDTKRPSGDQMPNRSPGYPEKYFQRFALPKETMRIIIGHLQMNDVYGSAKHFPLAEHRGHSLSAQAGLLYTTLFFDVETLMSEAASMREIVNRHFSDAWVVAYALGFTADLLTMWAPYNAAKQALGNTITPQAVKQSLEKHTHKLSQMRDQIDGYLLEGALHEERITAETTPLVSCLRQANTTIRWLLLQSMTTDTRLQAIFKEKCPAKDQVLQALVGTALLEDKARSLLEPLVSKRTTTLLEQRSEAAQKMDDLAAYFSGQHKLGRNVQNEHLETWFRDKQEVIESLNFETDEESLALGRKVGGLVKALQQVQAYHEIASKPLVVHFLNETCGLLDGMMRTVNLSADTLTTITHVADLAYAWKALGAYQGSMHTLLAKSPSSVKGLRALFQKLASILQVPLGRIRQARNNTHLDLVSNYYSGRLEQFMTSVLQEIPRLHFDLLAQIARFGAARVTKMPSKINLSDLNKYANESEQARLEIAGRAQKIALLMWGIWETEVAVLGAIRVEPRALLLEGLRRELAKRIEGLLSQLAFTASSKSGTLMRQDLSIPLANVAEKAHALRSGLEQVQDFLGISAAQLWQQELQRVVSYLLASEEHLLLRKRLPIPSTMPGHDSKAPTRFPDSDQPNSIGGPSFISRLVNALQKITEAKSTVGGCHSEWQSAIEGQQRAKLDEELFEVAFRAIGAPGFAAICKYLGFLVCGWLRKLYRSLTQILSDRQIRDTLVRMAKSSDGSGGRSEDAVLFREAARKLNNRSGPIMDILGELGQVQLLRRRLQMLQEMHGRLQVPTAFDALIALDWAGLMEARDLAENDAEALPAVAADFGEDAPSLDELALKMQKRLGILAEEVGLTNPIRQFYRIPPEGMPIEGLDVLLAFGVILATRADVTSSAGAVKGHTTTSTAAAPRTRWRDWVRGKTTEGPQQGGGLSANLASEAGSMTVTKAEELAALVAGLATLFQQLPKGRTDGFLCVLGIYLGGLTQEKPTKKENPFLDGMNIIDVLEMLLELLGLPRRHLASFVPQGLLELWYLE
eukprot:CAMPEP_0206508780 /NCGR_PEP_ID=MMETSP0324_2-20121206/58540_1 /ASSEMBLY_ACC=CAM_ASM_000836 /TAXON_ID=2866 /ORGANISM="Crypthecodinium cohnii, Strain Seligo" /LENGTH=1223 /DNA_ID=CAMNT_0053999717 /DNA_START=13 /DNA_END=3684 /DNA_ORIENTATION=+